MPPHHGWMQFRALQHFGKTGVRFVLLPGEAHGLKKLAHRRRKLEEELAWFDKYLFKTVQPENEALKPNSPLANLLRVKRAQADGRRVGILVKGTLIPETVKHGEVELGRFEVTRAQFAEFDQGYRVEPGRENWPANGVSFERAKAYCEWLSNRTGATYRLGTVAELEEFYGKADSGENTLDHWAGYTLNPDDAGRLRSKLRELGEGGPLLREVGSFKGMGDQEPIFDLGGNVAEWAIAEDGRGVPLGGSADQPADAKLQVRKPAPEYIGFRVVKEAAK